MPKHHDDAGKPWTEKEDNKIIQASRERKGPDYVQRLNVKRSEDAIVRRSKEIGYPLTNT